MGNANDANERIAFVVAYIIGTYRRQQTIHFELCDLILKQFLLNQVNPKIVASIRVFTSKCIFYRKYCVFYLKNRFKTDICNNNLIRRL